GTDTYAEPEQRPEVAEQRRLVAGHGLWPEPARPGCRSRASVRSESTTRGPWRSSRACGTIANRLFAMAGSLRVDFASRSPSSVTPLAATARYTWGAAA